MNNHPETNSAADHLVWSLDSGYAHDSFEQVTSRFDANTARQTHPGHPHTAWQLIDHLTICLRDLIDYVCHPDHCSPNFPDGLWNQPPDVLTSADWSDMRADYLTVRKELGRAVKERAAAGSLFDAVAFVSPTTWSRQILIAMDHQSYHLGQLASLAYAIDGPTIDHS